MFLVSIAHLNGEERELLRESLEPVSLTAGDTIKVEGSKSSLTTAMREGDDLFITLHDSLEYHFANFFTTDDIKLEFYDALMSPADVSDLFVMMFYIRHSDKIDRIVHVTPNGKVHAFPGDRFEIPDTEAAIEDFHREFNSLRIHFDHPIKGDPCELLILDFFKEVPPGEKSPVVYIADAEHHPKDVYVQPKEQFLVWRGEPPTHVKAGESFAFAFSLVGVNLKDHSLIVSVDGEPMPDWIELTHLGEGKYEFKGVLPDDMEGMPVIEVSLAQVKEGVNVVQQQHLAFGSSKAESAERSMTTWIMEAEIRGAFTVEAAEGATLGSSMAASYAPMLVAASVSSLSAINVLGLTRLQDAKFYSFSSRSFELDELDLSKVTVSGNDAEAFFSLFHAQASGQTFQYLQGDLDTAVEHSGSDYEEESSEDESNDVVLSNSSGEETTTQLQGGETGGTGNDLLAGEVLAVDDNYDVMEDGTFSIRPEGVLINDINTQPGDLRVSHINGQSMDVGESIILPSGARVFLAFNGRLFYAPNDVYEYLPEGVTAVDVFEYTITNELNSDSANIYMTIIGENDRPVMDSQTFSLLENDNSPSPFLVTPNSPLNFVFDTVIATDVDTPDVLTYQKFGGTGFTIFDVDPATGAISVIDPNPNTALNFEGPDNSYTLNVLVTDSLGAIDFASHTINVLDVNELPQAVPQTFDIDENSDPDDSAGTVQASDQDSGTNGDLTYTIVGGDGASIFEINSSTGEITVKDGANDTFVIDFESKDEYDLSVTIQDGGGLFITVPMKVEINDVNEKPVINDQSFNIDENSGEDTVVLPLPGIAVAFDQDGGIWGELTWTIEGGSGRRLFDIDDETGQISVARNADLDFESKDSYSLDVRVTDGGGLWDEASITISINDVNEDPTIESQTFNIDENSLPTTTVLPLPGIAIADDQDGGVWGQLTYSKFMLTDLGNGEVDGFALFNINSVTGKIEVASGAMLDHEAVDQYQYGVRVTDGGGLFADAVMTININDVNERPNIPANQQFNVNENSAEDTVVNGNMGIVAATDPDAVDNLTYTKVMTGDANDGYDLFDIKANNGEISVAAGADLNFEGLINSYSLLVRVTDKGNLTYDAPVTITLNDQNDTPEIVSQTFNVDENSAEDTGVLQGMSVMPVPVAASDQDTGSSQTVEWGQLTYSKYALSNLGNGEVDGLALFDIDATTGQISVASSATLDHETVSQYKFGVRVTDGGGKSADAVMTLDINDLNEDPTIAPQTFNVDENSVEDTAVVQGMSTMPAPVAASDQDDGVWGQLTYSKYALSNLGNGEVDGLALFDIDATTGQISVASGASLDHETISQYKFGVRVTDGGGKTADAVMTLDINDVNEDPTIAPQIFNVNENSVADTTVVQGMGTMPAPVAASDQDDGAWGQLTYSKYMLTDLGVGEVDGLALFDIDATTGQISVASGASLDHETVSQYKFGVRVTDGGGKSADAVMTLDINDVNEDPTIAPQTFNVDENSAADTGVLQGMSTMPVAVAASDQDDGVWGQLSYSKYMLSDLADGETDGYGLFSIDSSTGQISVASGASLDHETVSQYKFGVRVTDGGGKSADAVMTLDINDVNEDPTIAAQTFNIDENSVEDAAVVQGMGTMPAPVAASDQDDGVWGQLTYSKYALSNLGDGEVDGLALFDIDATTGQISVAAGASLDHETVSQYKFGVRVTDGGGKSADAVMTLDINDVNEDPTIAAQTFNLDENSAEDTAVVQGMGTMPAPVAASDQDDGTWGQLTYSKYMLTNLGNGEVDGLALFDIDATTGQISVAAGASLDHETTSQYKFGVRVTDGGGKSTDGVMTIDINDINDAPVINNQTITVGEDAVAGDSLDNVVAATDQDIAAGDALTYSLSGTDASLFTINTSTGDIKLATGTVLDYESANKTYTVTVGVTDNANASDSATITIEVRDVNEAPIISNQTFEVEENSAEGTGVRQVMGTMPAPVLASDPDAGDTIAYSIVGGTGASLFDISSTTGQITVARNALLDYESGTTSYGLTVQASDGTLSSQATITVNILDGDDVYNGSNGANTINAGGGNDTVNGNGGNDILNGQGGNDIINGGSGRDTIDGGDGNDTIDGGTNDDTILGGAGNDIIDGGSGDDDINGGADNDTLTGGSGTDILNGGPGMDLVIFEGQSDTSVDGGADTDTLWLKADGFNEDLTGSNIFSNFEVLELEADNSATGNSVSLNAAGVNDMTDSNNTLTVNGGANDTLNLASSDTWAATAVIVGYTTYTSAGGTVVHAEDTIGNVNLVP